MAKRPRFQEMMQRIREQRDVQYVIVYQLSRMNRNWMQSALFAMQLEKYGAKIESATENFYDTPIGEAMKGMTAVFNQLRSAEDSEDVKNKMGQKAKNGGTLGRANLGYLNVRDKLEDGREVRTIDVDPERGHYITLAFELFATNEYTHDELCETLTDRGLRTRPSNKSGGGSITESRLSQVLRDRYYLGYVTYKGVEYEGRHQPLVTPEVFDKVQEILKARTAAGERQRKHHHYLKGSLWCWRCHHEDGRQSRMIFQRANGNGGTYWYFFCRAKQGHACTEPYRDADEVEAAVVRHYATIGLEPEIVQRLRDVLYETVANHNQATRLLQQQLTSQLDIQEDNLLDLAADGELPQAKIRRRLHRLQERRQRLTEQRHDADTQLEAGIAYLEAALELVDDLQELYRQITDHGRRLLNQAVFEKLFVGDDGSTTGDELREPFRSVLNVRRGRSTQQDDICHVIELHRNEQEATEVTSQDSDGLSVLLITDLLSGGGSRACPVNRACVR